MTTCSKATYGVHEFMDEPPNVCSLCGEPRPVLMVTVSINKDLIFPKTLEVPKKTRRERIIDILSDSISMLLYYDRKEDEDLPEGGIEEAIEAGEITVEEMIIFWSDELREGLKNED